MARVKVARTTLARATKPRSSSPRRGSPWPGWRRPDQHDRAGHRRADSRKGLREQRALHMSLAQIDLAEVHIRPVDLSDAGGAQSSARPLRRSIRAMPGGARCAVPARRCWSSLMGTLTRASTLLWRSQSAMSFAFILVVSTMTFSPFASSSPTFARSSTSLNAPLPLPRRSPSRHGLFRRRTRPRRRVACDRRLQDALASGPVPRALRGSSGEILPPCAGLARARRRARSVRSLELVDESP